MKNIIITGGNSGFGLVQGKVFLTNNHKAIAKTRSASISKFKELKKSHSNTLEILSLNLINNDSIIWFSIYISFSSLNMLTSNAGILK